MIDCPDCTATGRTCPDCAPYLRDLATIADRIDALQRSHASLAAELGQRRAARAAERAAPAPPVPPAAPPEQDQPAGFPTPSPVPARGETPRPRMSRHAVQNVLLLLGGALLAVAAIVFTVVSWGNPTIRAGILIVVTAATLAVAWPLVRRGLDATAETIAFVGLALVPLDAVSVINAVHAYGPAEPNSGYSVVSVASATTWAVGTALIAAGWALYGRLAPLHLPRPTAIVIAQIPFPLAAIAVGPTPTSLALALLATAALDAVLLTVRSLRRRLNRAERDVAALIGAVAGLGGAGTAFVSAFLPASPGGAFRTAGVLAVAFVLGVDIAMRTVRAPRDERLLSGVWHRLGPYACTGVATLTAIAALAAPPAAWLRTWLLAPPYHMLPAVLAPAAYPLATAIVLVVAYRLPPDRGPQARLRPAALGAGLGMLGVLGLSAVPVVLSQALVPWLTLLDARLTPGDLGAPVAWFPEERWWPGAFGMLVALLTLALVAATGTTLRGSRRLTVPAVHPAKVRAACRLAFPILLAGSGLVLPTVGLPYPALVTAHLVLTAGLVAVSVRIRHTRTAWLAAALAGYVAVLTVLWSRAAWMPYVAATGALLVIFAVGGLVARTGTPARVTGTCGAVLAAGAATLTGWMAGPPRALPPFPYAAYLPLAVTAVCLLITFRSPRRAVTGVAMCVAFLTPIQTVWPGVWALRTGTVNAGLQPRLAVAFALIALLAAVAAWAHARVTPAVRTVATGVVEAFDVRTAYAYLAYGMAALAALTLGRGFFTAVGGPYLWVAHSWAGAPEAARAAVVPYGMWTAQPPLMPVLLAAALAAVLAAAAHRGRWAAFGVVRVAGPIALTPLPLAANVPYVVAVGFLVALTAVLALWAAVSRSPAGGATLWVGSLAAVWSLAERPATFVVLGVFAVIGAVCAIRGRGSPVAATAAAVTALTVGAEGAAVALGSGLPRQYAGMVVLAVAVLTARAAVQLAPRPAPGDEPAPEAGAGPGAWPFRGLVVYGLLAAAVALWGVAGAMTIPYELLFVVPAVGGATVISLARGVRRAARMPLLVTGWIVGGCAVAVYLPMLAVTAFGPYRLLALGWRGVPWEHGPPPVAPGTPGIAMAVVAIVTGATVVSIRMAAGPRRAYLVASAVVPVALTLLPYAAGFPYAAFPAIAAAVTVALAVQAATDRRSGVVPGVTALWSASQLIALTIVTKPSLLAGLAGLAVLATVVAWYGRTTPVRAEAAAAATAAGTGLATAGPLAVGIPAALTGFIVLAAAGLAAFVAAEARHRSTEIAWSVEVIGYVVAAAGLIMAGWGGRYLPQALTAAALLAAGVALRPGRRIAGLSAATVLAQFALWVWLARIGVRAPEAYTITVTLGLLLAGRVAPRLGAIVGSSSWWAYGPALLVTFVPSLLTAWSDPGLTRPVLLMVAALAVTLAGARYGTQAPLLLGGAVLLLTAGHELTPALVDLVSGGPRWAPIAVAGLALLFTGATYEHRLRDVRRAYRSIARMH